VIIAARMFSASRRSLISKRNGGIGGISPEADCLKPRAPGVDEENVSRLWADAQSILETAATAPDGSSDWTFLRSRDGGWEMIHGSSWSLEALAADRGADAVYQLRRSGCTLSVEGRAGQHSVRFEQPDPRSHLDSVLGRRHHTY
jgi:hypothetical protein